MFVSDFNALSQADSQILHPGTRLLFRHWETIRAENAAPKRDDLNLRKIRMLLPQLVMIESSGKADGYKWRLAGSDVCHLMRNDLTGGDALLMGDNFERATIRKLYASVLKSLQPCLLRYRLITDSGQMIGIEQLGLPLLDSSETRIFILGGIFAFNDISLMKYDSIVGFQLASARTIWTEHLPGDRLVERLTAPPPAPHRLRLIHGGKAD